MMPVLCSLPTLLHQCYATFGAGAAARHDTWQRSLAVFVACCCQVGEDPMNRTELAAFQQEMRSPRVSAEVASRARSPEVR
jgi:hypothetical protein